MFTTPARETTRTTAPARVLDNDDLRRFAPSVFAAQPHPDVSDRYRFIPTIEVVDLLRDRGFVPVKANQSRARLADRRDFTRHMIRFRHTDHLQMLAVGDEIPELVLTNSHDRSAAYAFYSGIFRLVCSNGLVVASEDFGSIKVKHTGSDDWQERVIDATYQIVEDAPRVHSQINDFKGIQLSPPQQHALAVAATEIRDGIGEGQAAQLLSPRRPDDRPAPDGSRSLWTTGNTIQEHLIKGGIRGRTDTGRRTTTREVKAVDADIKTNRAVWRLMEEMAKISG